MQRQVRRKSGNAEKQPAQGLAREGRQRRHG
jgi:hypothetical protein